MSVTINSFYKVIVMRVGLFESEIIDERHFNSSMEASIFCDKVMNTSDNMAVMVRM